MSTHHLSRDLNQVLLDGHPEDGVVLREIVAAVGPRGYGLLLVILALPSAMPVPAPGYSTPFGVALFLIGLQIVVGRNTPWLPDWVLSRKISPANAERMVGFLVKILDRLERWIRPRWEWVCGDRIQWVAGGLTMFMGFLMIFPIPLTNSAPAVVIFLLGVGMVEKDGLLLGAAWLLGLVAALFYLAAFFAIFYFGLQGMDEVKEILRGWMGR